MGRWLAHGLCDATCDFDPALRRYGAQTVFSLRLITADVAKERGEEDAVSARDTGTLWELVSLHKERKYKVADNQTLHENEEEFFLFHSEPLDGSMRSR